MRYNSGRGHYAHHVPHVHAVVNFPPTGSPQTVNTLTLAVEDVTIADAASERIAQTQLKDLVIPPEGAAIEIDLEVDETSDPRRRYAVRVHASQSGEERFAPGDFLSTTHVPAKLTGNEHVELELTHLRATDG